MRELEEVPTSGGNQLLLMIAGIANDPRTMRQQTPEIIGKSNISSSFLRSL
jgi:hypothetical protein